MVVPSDDRSFSFVFFDRSMLVPQTEYQSRDVLLLFCWNNDVDAGLFLTRTEQAGLIFNFIVIEITPCLLRAVNH